VAGFGAGEILAATIHRMDRGGSGPAIAVVTNHTFQTAAGSETLSDPDRERMMAGELYLRIASRSPSTNNLRIVLKPANPK